MAQRLVVLSHLFPDGYRVCRSVRVCAKQMLRDGVLIAELVSVNAGMI